MASGSKDEFVESDRGGIWEYYLHEKKGQSASCKECKFTAEMALFATTGKRGRCLQQTFDYLMTIPPTSVEAERAFSAAGLLYPKLLPSLEDRTLYTLCFFTILLQRK